MRRIDIARPDRVAATRRRVLPRHSAAIILLAALPGCVPPAAIPGVAPPPTSATLTPTAVDPARIAPDATIGQSVASTPGLSTLAAEVRAAGLGTMLDGPGPYTLFAPSDAAYARLAPGVAQDLLAPDNRATLALLLRNHAVAGEVDVAALTQRIEAGGGRATLTTLAGQPITATLTDGVVTLTSSSGEKAYVEAADIRQANGMLQVINGVLTPTLP